MCETCRDECGQPAVWNDQIGEFVHLLGLLYAQPDGAVGGPLHVEVDDGNIDRDIDMQQALTLWAQIPGGDFLPETWAICDRIAAVVNPMPYEERRLALGYHYRRAGAVGPACADDGSETFPQAQVKAIERGLARDFPLPDGYEWRFDATPLRPAQPPPVCGLCGYWAGGGFWTPIPHHPDAVMHTMGCGPAFHGWPQMAAPTHERLDDGTYRRVPVESGDVA